MAPPLLPGPGAMGVSGEGPVLCWRCTGLAGGAQGYEVSSDWLLGLLLLWRLCSTGRRYLCLGLKAGEGPESRTGMHRVHVHRKQTCTGVYVYMYM